MSLSLACVRIPSSSQDNLVGTACHAMDGSVLGWLYVKWNDPLVRSDPIRYVAIRNKTCSSSKRATVQNADLLLRRSDHDDQVKRIKCRAQIAAAQSSSTHCIGQQDAVVGTGHAVIAGNTKTWARPRVNIKPTFVIQIGRGRRRPRWRRVDFLMLLFHLFYI